MPEPQAEGSFSLAQHRRHDPCPRMTDNGRADRGEPLLRRMREFCEVVNFEPGAQLPP